MKLLLARTGVAVWLGLLMNALTVGCALSFYALPSTTSFHAGATEFEVLICCIVAAVVVIAAVLVDLAKRKWWALGGLALALTPWPMCSTILDHIFRVKHFQIEF